MSRTIRDTRRGNWDFATGHGPHMEFEPDEKAGRDGRLVKRPSSNQKFDKRQYNRDDRHQDRAVAASILRGCVDVDGAVFSKSKTNWWD